MYSIAFPNMLSYTKTNLVEDYDATLQNLKLLLYGERNSLFGDPYYGSALKRILFSQNDSVLVDIIIDEIYTDILTFMPQIYVERKDITVKSNGTSVYTEIRCVNRLNYETNLYRINLTSTDDVD